MQKITALSPGAYVNGPNNHSDRAVWFVNGVTYVPDGHPYVEHATTTPGYTVETVETVPTDWTAAVEAMKAGGIVQLGSPLRDAAVDPQPGDNPPGALTREDQAKAAGAQP